MTPPRLLLSHPVLLFSPALVAYLFFLICNVFSETVIREAQLDARFPSSLGSPRSSCVPMRRNQAQFDYDIFNKSLETSFNIFLEDLLFVISQFTS